MQSNRFSRKRLISNTNIHKESAGRAPHVEYTAGASSPRAKGTDAKESPGCVMRSGLSRLGQPNVRGFGFGGSGANAAARPAKQRDAGSAAFQRSTWVSSCRMAMSAARRAVRLLRFARDGGAMQRRISNVIQLASPIAWCRRTGARHVRRTANEDRGRGGRGARGRRDGTHAGPRMPVLARRRHISVIGYRIRTTANRAQSKTGAEAPVLL